MSRIARVVTNKRRNALRRRPALERLESRLALSTVSFNAGTGMLTILGTNAGETLTVYDDGAGNVGVDRDNNGGAGTLACEGDTFAVDFLASGVKKVKIDLRDGDDTAAYLFCDGLTTDRTLDITMGRGSDVLDVRGNEVRTIPYGTFTYMDGDIVADLTITARAGTVAGVDLAAAVDDIEAVIGGGDGFALLGDVQITLRGATGKDTLVAKTYAERTSADSVVRLDLSGGNGDDSLVGRAGAVDYDAGGGPGLDWLAAVQINLRGDNGNDTLSGQVAVYSENNNAYLTGAANLHIDGGNGNDSLEAWAQSFTDMANSQLRGAVTIDLDGGSGNDSLLAIAEADTYLGVAQFSSVVSLDLDGGSGNDTAISQAGGFAWTDGDAEVTGDIVVSMDGGSGNDTLENYVAAYAKSGDANVASGVSIQVRVNGNAGDDSVTAKAGAATGPSGSGQLAGTLAVDVHGDAGNDNVCVGVTATELTAGAIVDVEADGGTGIDRVAAELFFARLNGAFELEMNGGTGNDTLIASVTAAGGSGGAAVEMKGGLGNDVVSYRQEDATGNVSAVLNGDAGVDLAHVLVISGKASTRKSFNTVDAAVLDPDCLPI